MRILLPVVLAGCGPEPHHPGTDAVNVPSTDQGGTGGDASLDLTRAWTVQMRNIAGVGDVNGDGFDDVVAETWYTTARSELYLGSPTGFGVLPAWTDERPRSDDLGSAAPAGDVNGDGFADVLFGNSNHDAGPGHGPGRAGAFYGSPWGLAETADWVAFGESGTMSFAAAFSAAGDVNGDGYDDVVVSALDYTHELVVDGKVFLFLGSPEGLETTPSWTAEGIDEGSWFGSSVAGAGDVNGDGYDDLVVGAPYLGYYAVSGGRAYVYLGSASGLGVEPAWTGHGDEYLSKLTGYGDVVRGAGDVNGDGFDDLLIGAPYTVRPDGGQGEAHVVLGSATGPSETSDWQAESHQDRSAYASSLAGGGDLNGDGYDDVAIGAAQYDDVTYDDGRVEVYLGSAAGLRTESAWSASSHMYMGWFSSSLGSAGDVNGDGFDDLVVGAGGFPNADYLPGRVWVYTGSAAE